MDFAYDAASQFATISRYANLAGTQLVAQSAYTFDNASRLTALTHTQGQTTLAGYTWALDAVGSPTAFTSVLDGSGGYTYDSTGQLTGETYSYQTSQSHSYDANGNRTNTGYTTGTDNRLTSDGVYNYLYDAEGNRTRRTRISDGAVTEYTWDYRNRLTMVVNRNSANGPATKVVEYTYDAFNRRATKDVDDDGDETFDRGERYVYDGDNIVLQFNRASTLTDRYLHGPAVDQVLCDEDGSGVVSWFLPDNQGTIRDVARYDSQTGTTSVVDHLVYDAFGRITSQTNSTAQPHFAFTGRDWDPDASLYYYRARWYDPSTGRFLSEDPSRFRSNDTNLNRYVWNRPTVLRDPTGRDASGGNDPSGGGDAGSGGSGGSAGSSFTTLADGGWGDGQGMYGRDPGYVDPMHQTPGLSGYPFTSNEEYYHGHQAGQGWWASSGVPQWMFLPGDPPPGSEATSGGWQPPADWVYDGQGSAPPPIVISPPHRPLQLDPDLNVWNNIAYGMIGIGVGGVSGIGAGALVGGGVWRGAIGGEVAHWLGAHIGGVAGTGGEWIGGIGGGIGGSIGGALGNIPIWMDPPPLDPGIWDPGLTGPVWSLPGGLQIGPGWF